MTEIIWEYLLFLAKAATIIFAIILVFGGIVSTAIREKKYKSEGYIEIIHINNLLQGYQRSLQMMVLSPKAFKKIQKQEEKAEKHKRQAAPDGQREKNKTKDPAQQDEDGEATTGRLFYIQFSSELGRQPVSHLQHEVSAILVNARAGDKVLVSIESGGGPVSDYGFAAALLQRLRDKGLELTVAVDKVAASGGYLMACVANKIIAAPFAFVGSIGVVAQVPNFYRLLQEKNVDMDVFTAGEYKRQVTLFGENTESGKQKFQQSLEDIHEQFKQIVAENRLNLDIDQIATGEVWLAQQAMTLGLVDELMTCDAFLMQACDEADVYQVRWVSRESVLNRLSREIEQGVKGLLAALRKPFRW